MTPRAAGKRNWLRLWPRLFLPRMLKRRVPTSLFARSLLIIVLPIALIVSTSPVQAILHAVGF